MAADRRKPAVLGLNTTAFLDLLRAAAANLVLFGHWGDVFHLGHPIPAGQIGVGVFFVLSGFLIMQSSLARLQRPGPYFAPYMIDRFARIFTAYVPALILIAALDAELNLGQWAREGISTGPIAFLGNLLLLQDYPVFQAMHRLTSDTFYIRPYNTAEPFWTIPIEFWIYVWFGLCCFGMAAREKLVRGLPLVLGLVALPVVLWNVAAGGGDGLALVWLIGAAAAFVWNGAWHRSRHRGSIGVAVSLGSLISLVGRAARSGWNFQDLGVMICGAMLLLGCIAMLETIPPLPKALRTASAAAASYSFSLYLIHNTVLVVVAHCLPEGHGRALVAMLAAHVAAVALYWTFEQHHRAVAALLKQRILLRPAPPARWAGAD